MTTFTQDEPRYFSYGDETIAHLSKHDPRLAEIITQIGHVHREVDSNLCSAVIHHIIGQQISTKAQATIWSRIHDEIDEITPGTLLEVGEKRLQSLGMTFRKARYIMSFAEKMSSGEFDLNSVRHMDDADAIVALKSLDGIGTWTAEMILLFCLERPNILSYGDLAIQRGLRMVYHHRRITPDLYRRYLRRYTPYASTASLYLWEVAAGAIPGMRDPGSRAITAEGRGPTVVDKREYRNDFD